MELDGTTQPRQAGVGAPAPRVPRRARRRSAATARPTGRVVFLFTDMEGSTALWENAPGAMRLAHRRHDEILAEELGRSGTVFSRAGDGFGVAFTRAEDAVEAALAAQRLLAEEPWPGRLPIRVRMGVNRGCADERDGDYFGPPVNRAARVMQLAEPGSVLATEVLAREVSSLPTVECTDRGLHRLRGVDGLTRLYAVARRTSAPDGG